MPYVGKFVNWCQGLWGRYRAMIDEEEKLNSQFFLTLRSIYLRMKPQTPSAEQIPIVDRIDSLLNGPKTWAPAYEIEQLLLQFYDDDAVMVELSRRLVEAEQKLSEKVVASYKEEAKDADLAKQRALLARIVNDLQWRYSVNETSRKYLRIVTTKTGWVFIASIAFFVIFFGFFSISGFQWTTQNRTWDITDPQMGVFLSAVAGLWGASFSMLTGLRERLRTSSFDELKVMRRWGYSISRAIIGLGAASILYFLMFCGFVTGSVFPILNPQTSQERIDQTLNAVKATALSRIAPLSTQENEERVTKTVDTLVQRTKAVMDLEGLEAKRILDLESRNLLTIFCPKKSEAKESGTQKPGDQESGANESEDTILCKGPDGLNPPLQKVADQLASDLHRVVKKGIVLGLESIALLVVWSFLAGFSEKFVPNLLAKTEEKASTASTPSTPPANS